MLSDILLRFGAGSVWGAPQVGSATADYIFRLPGLGALLGGGLFNTLGS